MGNNGVFIPMHRDLDDENYLRIFYEKSYSHSDWNDTSWNMELSISSGHDMRFQSRISQIDEKISRQFVSFLIHVSFHFNFLF